MAELKPCPFDKYEMGKRLMRAFPNSFINYQGEFIAHRYANEYFILDNCQTELDVKCKVLEWFSRGAHKTAPYRGAKKNQEFHNFMLSGINAFLGTEFDENDMDIIYTYLGNACNHKKTIRFIESGYDMGILGRAEDGRDK